MPAKKEYGREDLLVLPCELPLVGLRLEITDDLERYSDHGQVHSVLLRFRVSGATELDRLEFELNGVPLPQTPVRKVAMLVNVKPYLYYKLRWLRHALDLSTKHSRRWNAGMSAPNQRTLQDDCTQVPCEQLLLVLLRAGAPACPLAEARAKCYLSALPASG